MRPKLAVLLAVSTLAAAACSTPKAEPQSTFLPDGWIARYDAAAPATGALSADSASDSLTFTPAPAAIYYRRNMKAEKNYTLSATFSQRSTPATPEPYGLFIAGADLDKDAVRYTAFVLRSDGKYQIATPSRVIVDWTPAADMREPKGVKTSNTLTIRALEGAVHFLIAEREVHQMPRADVGGDGFAGLRIGNGLHVQVDKLKLEEAK